MIGIVKKNGIMLVDFAIVAERDHHMSIAISGIGQLESWSVTIRSHLTYMNLTDAHRGVLRGIHAVERLLMA